ncbi:putative phage tail assembly chaperone [Maridesulfovibrio sp.]|uniref:putative phage tail assembly chaperone n=1 Tax=Maridesulfovibrio sp. TaxID=2795000 RepID=UPI0029CA9684|nr:putative phage tail assembly chaperone [Maridesulfovibrio sp.]
MPIKLTVQDKDLEFNVEVAHYNSYINEMQPNNKVTPAHNFLMRTVADSCKNSLKELLKLPGASIQIAAAILEEYTPDLEIRVGK